MRTLPLDVAALRFLAGGGEARPAQVWTDGKATGQATDDQGRLLWQADVIVSDGETASTVRIKFPAPTAPKFGAMDPVQVVGLRAVLVGERLYFSATSLAAAAPAAFGEKATR